MDYHGDLYLYNVCLGSNKNSILLLLYLPANVVILDYGLVPTLLVFRLETFARGYIFVRN